MSSLPTGAPFASIARLAWSSIVLLVSAALALLGCAAEPVASAPTSEGQSALLDLDELAPRRDMATTRALYVTTYGNTWHDYPAQVKAFTEGLSAHANVELTVVGKSKDDALQLMRTKGFARAFDAVIYNMCLADNRDYEMIDNVIAQTRELGVPAVLLHCSMHSFRGTSTDLWFFDKWRLGRDVDAWKAANGDKPFPYWHRFTGVDTTAHDWARGLTMQKAGAHPISAGLPDVWSTPKDELYRNVVVQDDVTPVYTAYSSESRRDHAVAWVREEASGGRVFATTLGHDDNTFGTDTYFKLVARGLLWAAGRLDQDGQPVDTAGGTAVHQNYQNSLRCRPGDVVEPSSVEDVRLAVTAAARAGTPFRVVSLDKSNSNSGIVCPESGGMLINVRSMNRILEIDRDAMTVTVEPGIRLVDLSKQLAEEGLAINTMPDYTGVGVVGGMATGAHNSSLKIAASVADMAVSMKIIDTRGQTRTFEGESLDLAAVHLGLLGAVVEVTLRVEPQFKLQYGYESGSDDGLEEHILARVAEHDYAKVMWFAGSGRYVLDYYDRVPLDTAGESQHNLWSSTAGLFKVTGDLPYRFLNGSPQWVQCASANVRSRVWLPPIEARDSPRSTPVGYAHQMLGSYCEPGTCAWDVDGVRSRTMEAAFPVRQLKAWMSDVRQILEARTACFPVLGLYLRFSKASDRAMAFNYGEDTAAFEIHVPKDADEVAIEQGAEVYDEILQMTLRKYGGRPHWGKNSTPAFVGLGAEQYPQLDAFMSLKSEMDPTALLENDFWRTVLDGDVEASFPGCVLSRDCLCQTDADCGDGKRCVEGAVFEDTRVCL